MTRFASDKEPEIPRPCSPSLVWPFWIQLQIGHSSGFFAYAITAGLPTVARMLHRPQATGFFSSTKVP